MFAFQYIIINKIIDRLQNSVWNTPHQTNEPKRTSTTKSQIKLLMQYALLCAAREGKGEWNVLFSQREWIGSVLKNGMNPMDPQLIIWFQ